MFERCLYFNTQNLARTINRIWVEEFKKYDLSPAHAYLLRLVLARPGILQRDIAIQLGLSKSTVTRFVDSLEGRGFISRRFSNTDGRESAVYPERKATAIQRKLESSGDRLYRQMATILGEESLKSLVGEQRKFRDRLES